MSWDDVALRYGTDKASSHHDYMGHYEKRIGKRRVLRLLELGVAHGHSLRMWAEIFSNALIVGVDDSQHCRLHQRIGIDVIIADCNDAAKMAAVSMLYGPFDVVIDDCSHQFLQMRTSFEELYPRLAPGGVYVVEDFTLSRTGGPDGPTEIDEFAMRWNGAVEFGRTDPPGDLIFVEHP